MSEDRIVATIAAQGEPVRPRSWSRLVYVTETGDTYHHRPHHGRYAVTWTQRFAHDGLEMRPCQTCFRGDKPRHRGRLDEVGRELVWSALRPTQDHEGVR